LKIEGIEPVLLPPQSPNLNAHLEGFRRSLKEQCLAKLISLGEDMLWKAVDEFLAHNHGERNHHGPGNQIIQPGDEVGNTKGSRKKPGKSIRKP
jgi:hypothetical protein